MVDLAEGCWNLRKDEVVEGLQTSWDGVYRFDGTCVPVLYQKVPIRIPGGDTYVAWSQGSKSYSACPYDSSIIGWSEIAQNWLLSSTSDPYKSERPYNQGYVNQQQVAQYFSHTLLPFPITKTSSETMKVIYEFVIPFDCFPKFQQGNKLQNLESMLPLGFVPPTSG